MIMIKVYFKAYVQDGWIRMDPINIEKNPWHKSQTSSLRSQSTGRPHISGPPKPDAEGRASFHVFEQS